MKAPKMLAYVMLLSLPLTVSYQATAQAAMISTQQIVQQAQLDQQRTDIIAFMQREDIRGQLESWGVSPQEAEQRVAAMTDAEVAEVAAKLQELPAGEGAVGAVVGAAVLIFLVLLITDILGFTKVYDFTR